MPGPAVYVVVAIGAVATGYVLKQFVYDPHIAPIIRDWREQRNARRNSRQRPYSPVPAAPEYRSPRRSPTPSRSPSPIELDTVVASEVDGWRSFASMRHRRTNNALDDRIPDEVDYPLLSPSTPLARSPPHAIWSPPHEGAPLHPPQPLSTPATLHIPDLATFATDVDYTASSVDVTPLVQTAELESNLTSPQFTITSPFSDVFELAQSQISEVGIARAGSGSDDELVSLPSSMSSVSSVSATDDEDDDGSFGSGGSWHDIRNEIRRS
ncbi:hypothetical protein BJ322DRAFT_349948 [Thelephora terrestris]|uniref:Transmembrane protein n=1 Tax=Thelephora terrestris TaxID=56493 RepID=A0A9P6H6V1_9AGAM|nr:hypothetical protein BJ322DRAFT_349948 [Thelephora terrestris]